VNKIIPCYQNNIENTCPMLKNKFIYKKAFVFHANIFVLLPKLMSLAISPVWCENFFHLPQARWQEADITCTMQPTAKGGSLGDVQGDCGERRPWPVYLPPYSGTLCRRVSMRLWVEFHSVIPMPVLSRGDAMIDTARSIPNCQWTINLSLYEWRAEHGLHVTRGSQ
jgi:hypothetical protein